MFYAHNEMSSIELKKEVIKYLKSIDTKHPLLQELVDVHENRITTFGKYMYILNNGADIPEEVLPRLLPELERTILADKQKVKSLNKLKESKESTTPVSIQERLLEKVKNVSAEIDGWIDDFIVDKKLAVKSVEDFSNLFKSRELKAVHMHHMRDIFEPKIAELALVFENSDKNLSEGYSNFSKPELKKLDSFYKNILNACDMFQKVAKADRLPRKKKPVSQEKLVAKVKYKKEDAALGIASVNVLHLLGAKEVWVYNTKTRKLANYRAVDERGIGVKGTSLINYSTDSIEKTLRKPLETLTDFKKSSKVKLRTFLKDLSTVDAPANGKLNEHHVILRADR
jgi:hypothetical protein